jgi:two-component system, cell cycle sensor histidine kinase and response regulator CckA
MFYRVPAARKLLAIVAIFVCIVLCVFYVGATRADILTGVRAFVAGEGLWSKAEKRAALSLTKYAADHREADYQEYLAEIAVPLGDKQARLQLSRPSPDMQLVHDGFVQGRNSPQDVDSMSRLLRRFGRFQYVHRAIAVWTEGDRQIDELRSLADQLHREMNSSHPDQQRIQQMADQVVAVDARLTPLEDEFSATLSEGARWIDRVLSVVAIGATALLLLIGVAFSIAVMNRMRNSEEKYRNLINTANDAIVVIDASTRRILDANNRAYALLGRSENELVGLPEASLYPGREGKEPALLDPSATGGSRELELLTADGSIIPAEVNASRTELGGRSAILGVFRDIRERREAAAVLRRSEDRFSYLIQNLSDVITVVAVDGTMLYQSPSIERVTGYNPSELLGKSFFSFIHHEDEPAVRAALERVTLGVGSAAPPEFRFRHKNGAWVWFESVGNNLLNDVAVGGIVVTSRDVSARRELEDQVRQSQKMEAVGRLAGGIAHDFNNMLMVMQGYAHIVLHEGGISSSARKSVETILRTTESAANLTRQLLSFSRKHAFSPQVLDLNSLVNRMSEMLLGLLREEMEFGVRLSPQESCISADPAQIEQVIMNLVVNARDAMPQGGTLRLETKHVHSDSMHLNHTEVEAGDYVMLAVSDTGVGMDPETQSHIFEPFFTTKSKDEGTGLGLSVVYNIVRASGGHVRVLSEIGKGTTLQVYFPRVSAPVTPEAVVPRMEASRSGMETILVAEDQPDLRWMICQFLQALGYSVLEATDGRDAIALAEQYTGRIDVVVTDVVMPHFRGPEVVRRICKKRPDIKVIYMSGYTEGEVTAVAEENDTDTPLLQKPFELDILAAKIREVLEARTRR